MQSRATAVDHDLTNSSDRLRYSCTRDFWQNGNVKLNNVHKWRCYRRFHSKWVKLNWQDLFEDHQNKYDMTHGDREQQCLPGWRSRVSTMLCEVDKELTWPIVSTKDTLFERASKFYILHQMQHIYVAEFSNSLLRCIDFRESTYRTMHFRRNSDWDTHFHCCNEVSQTLLMLFIANVYISFSCGQYTLKWHFTLL